MRNLAFCFLLLFACSDPRHIEVCEDYGRVGDGTLELHQPFLPIEVMCETAACYAAVDFWEGYVILGDDGYKIQYTDLPVPGRTRLYYADHDVGMYFAGEIQHVEIFIDYSMCGHYAESMVIAHEIGHALGLAHDTCRASVMTPGDLRELTTVQILPGDVGVLSSAD